jgi:type VI secretion system protein ImpK
LAEDIAAGTVTIVEYGDRTTIRIRGDGLFGSGRTDVNESFHPLLTRIAQALNRTEGRIVVVGHTDNLKPRVGRPSNWVISRERANSVKDLIGRYVVPSQRIETDGRADTEPLVPNSSAENRARNRRVEISLFGN